MPTRNARPDDGSGVRCDVCGDRFENEHALHRHVENKGLLW